METDMYKQRTKLENRKMEFERNESKLLLLQSVIKLRKINSPLRDEYEITYTYEEVVVILNNYWKILKLNMK